MTDLMTSLAPPGRQPLRNARTEQAFTLIELLIVIAVLGVLMTLATVAWKEAKVRAYDAQALICARGIKTAEAIHYNDTRTFTTFDNLAGADIGACKVVFGNAGLNSSQVVVQLPGSMLAAVSQTAEVLQAPFMARAENAATTTTAPTAPVGNATDTSYAYTVLHPSGRTTFLASENYLGPVGDAPAADVALAGSGSGGSGSGTPPGTPVLASGPANNETACTEKGGDWDDDTLFGAIYGCYTGNQPSDGPICLAIGGVWLNPPGYLGQCDSVNLCAHGGYLFDPVKGCSITNEYDYSFKSNATGSGGVPATLNVYDGANLLKTRNITLNNGNRIWDHLPHFYPAITGAIRFEITYPAQSGGLSNDLSTFAYQTKHWAFISRGDREAFGYPLLPTTENVDPVGTTTTTDGTSKTLTINVSNIEPTDYERFDLTFAQN